jgi:hypothetical protein
MTAFNFPFESVSGPPEAHVAFFVFGAEALILLLFVSASANFSFAYLAPSPLIERSAALVLSLSLSGPCFFSHK